MTKNIIILVSSVFLLSCCIRDVKKNSETKHFEIISPTSLENFKIQDTILFSLKKISKYDKIDSINIICEGQKYSVLPEAGFRFKWSAEKIKTGLNNIELIIYSDNFKEMHNINLIFKSNIEPENLKYKVIKKYPHDNNSYTQGLFWYNGYLYESAGRKGMSNIRKIDLNKNKVIKENKLENTYFAEGIAPIGDRIYQITWQEKTGFVYDIENLNLISTFNYSFNEAWGLTSDNNKLYMSDGSHYIYIIEPETFSQIDILEVYDNQKKVEKLNELEYVCGNILANIYGANYIVVIDSLGRVVAKVDFKDLIDDKYKNNYDYVLNGIAFNYENKHFYITGKLWDYIYEVEIPEIFKFCISK